MRIVPILYICIDALHHICSINFKEKSSSMYTFFFCLNDKPYWVSEKNNTVFF
jgi:hypothetical protein